MDQDPKTYRDPKVTTDTHRGGRFGQSSMNWLWIALGVIVGLVVLAWLFGWMGEDRVSTVPADGGVVIEDSTTAPAQPPANPGTTTEGATGDTGQPVDITPDAEAPEAGDDVGTVPVEPAD